MAVSLTDLRGLRLVVSPGFLTNPEVRRWLGGIEPAWTMLDIGSYTALRQEPLPGNEAIRLEPGLSETDLAGSSVLRTARILLERTGDEGGLKLTATGNLARSAVAEMIKLIEWPDFDKAQSESEELSCSARGGASTHVYGWEYRPG